MKNSLFKRAFAAVATVPLALTQCLAVANAVNVNDVIVVSTKTDAPATDEFSVDTIMYIEPTETDMEMYYSIEDENGIKYIKDSDWNLRVNSFINQLNPTGPIDLNPIFENVINRAGGYTDLAKSAVEKIGDANYSIDDNNNIVISASVDDITPIIEEFAQSKVNLKQLAEDYNMPELNDIKFFDGIEIAGDIKIVIDASDLANTEGKTINGSVTFIDKATGTVYGGAAIADYVVEKMEALQNSVNSTVTELLDKYDLTDEEIESLVEESQEYKDLIQNLKEGYTPAEGEIEQMILESVEFQNLVADYMADNGVDYAAAEAAIKDSEDFKEMTERFSNGINLSDDEIKDILYESDEYNELVTKYMDDNDVDYDSAVDAVLQSDEYKALLADFTDKYTYTDEEISAMVKGSDDYRNKIAEIKVEYADTYKNMKAKADSAVATFDKIVSKAKSAKTKALEKYETVKTYSGEWEFENYAAMAEAVNNNELFNKAVNAAQNKAPDSVAGKIPNKLPTDISNASSNQTVQKIFSEIINQLGANIDYSINVAPEDITSLIESCTDISISVNSGIVKFTGKLTDDDTNDNGTDAATYIASTYGAEIADIDGDGYDVYKEATVELDFTNLDTAGNASVEFQLKRVVEAKPKTTTTTVTSTTTDTTISTTTVDPTLTTTEDPTLTTTAEDPTQTTTAVDPSQTTTAVDPSQTTTAVDPSQTTTAEDPSQTTTAEDPSQTTTAVDPTQTTTAVDPTQTTTAEDPTQTTTAVDPSQTTTADPSLVTTTSEIEIVGTTTVSAEVSVSVEVESVDAFYFTIDKEFDKEQVQSISYEATVKYVTIDEAGNVINEETVDDVLTGDITDKFTFNDTPVDVYDKEAIGIYQFIYEVPLYASEDIVNGDVVIFNAGDVITTTDGDDATVTAYVGVKGDANLNGIVDSKDASVVLTWYAKAATGNTEEAFSSSELVVREATGEIINETLDRFAAFLADTDNENDADNCKPTKVNKERMMNSKDASFILSSYSAVSTGATGGKDATRELWNEILGDYAKKED